MIKVLVPDMPTADEILPYLRTIDANRWYSNFGPMEQEFCRGVKGLLDINTGRDVFVATLSSATSGLELAIRAVLPNRGKRILLPALTFAGTVSAVVSSGHESILSDVDIDSWCLTPEIARDIVRLTKIDMVVPVAAYGASLDVKEWVKFQHETRIPVVIDAAGAFGNLYPLGDLVIIYSLHATKPFGVGEGGLAVSCNEEVVEKIKELSNFGITPNDISSIGSNAKLSEYHAAIGLIQLHRWNEIRSKRKNIYDLFQSTLAGHVSFQKLRSGDVPSVLMVRLDVAAEQVQHTFQHRGIETRRWYCPSIPHTTAYRKCLVMSRNGESTLEQLNNLENGLLGLPYHNFMSESDVKMVSQCLLEDCHSLDNCRRGALRTVRKY